MNIILLFLTLSIKCVYCRDFYMGMFKRNDFLVAQDSLYRGATPHRFTYAKYGRMFKCPITYFRMVDRLGMGRGPTVEVVRGGLMKKYIVVRIKSPYNLPISVNIYVGCENLDKSPMWKRPSRQPVTVPEEDQEVESGEPDDGSGSGDEDTADGSGDASGDASGDDAGGEAAGNEAPADGEGEAPADGEIDAPADEDPVDSGQTGK